MIDPSALVDSLVTLLHDISELVLEVGDDPARIYAYHDQYPRFPQLESNPRYQAILWRLGLP